MLDAWSVDPEDPIDLPAPLHGGYGIEVTARSPWPRASPSTRHQLTSGSRHPQATPAHSTCPGRALRADPLLATPGQGRRRRKVERHRAGPWTAGLAPLCGSAIDDLVGEGVRALSTLVEQTARLAGLLDLAWTRAPRPVPEPAHEQERHRPQPLRTAAIGATGDRLDMVAGDDRRRQLS